MGPRQNRSSSPQKAEARKRRAGLPRLRRCLLKGCERRYRPRSKRQRYCSPKCRQAARQWSRWKAQQKYRNTGGGKQKRNGQSRRYRERCKQRQRQETRGAGEPARVITKNFF